MWPHLGPGNLARTHSPAPRGSEQLVGLQPAQLQLLLFYGQHCHAFSACLTSLRERQKLHCSRRKQWRWQESWLPLHGLHQSQPQRYTAQHHAFSSSLPEPCLHTCTQH